MQKEITKKLDNKGQVEQIIIRLGKEYLQSLDLNEEFYFKGGLIQSKFKDYKRVDKWLRYFIVNFGKYKGKSLAEIQKKDMDYFGWLIDNWGFKAAIIFEEKHKEKKSGGELK